MSLCMGRGRRESRGDGEGEMAGGETRAWLVLTMKAGASRSHQRLSCFGSVHAFIFPLEKWLTQGLS